LDDPPITSGRAGSTDIIKLSATVRLVPINWALNGTAPSYPRSIYPRSRKNFPGSGHEKIEWLARICSMRRAHLRRRRMFFSAWNGRYLQLSGMVVELN
jgi:hypothetical protein